MAIPEEIKAVPRPKSTVIREAFGRYLVIKRTSKRVPGKKTPRAVDLGTIGEIKGGRYVEIREVPKRRAKRSVDVKDYGSIAVADKAGRGILGDLKSVFRPKDAEKLYALALLKSVDADIRDREVKACYETSFISESLPGVALSENTVAAFLKETGKEHSLIRRFLTERARRFAGRKQVIDGTLKDSDSTENGFSEFSRKGRVKGSKDLSLLYSFDLESKEPVLMKVYSGNVVDNRSIADFVAAFSVRNAILVMDKGFCSKANAEALGKMEGVTYILPLRRGDKALCDSGMYDGISTPLDSKEASVTCKRAACGEGRHLYSFRDPAMAGEEDAGYVARKRKAGSFSKDEYERERKRFGVIPFVSNKELTCEEVYEAYMGRWEIEIMFNMMKDIVGLDTVNVHSDYSVVASEFVNYLAVVISQRVKRMFRETMLCKRKGKDVAVSDAYSYKQAMKLLSKIKKVRQEGGGWETNYPANCKYIQELGEKLGV